MIHVMGVSILINSKTLSHTKKMLARMLAFFMCYLDSLIKMTTQALKPPTIIEIAVSTKGD